MPSSTRTSESLSSLQRYSMKVTLAGSAMVAVGCVDVRGAKSQEAGTGSAMGVDEAPRL